jgi:hypothetical protein
MESRDSCGKSRQIILLDHKKFWLVSLVACYQAAPSFSYIGSYLDITIDTIMFFRLISKIVETGMWRLDC